MSNVCSGLNTCSVALLALCYYCTYCIFTPSRHMVLTRFPTLTGLVSSPPVLPPCFSLASSASCDAFTEQQTSFMEPGPCSTQARSSLGKNKRRDGNGGKAVGCQSKKIVIFLFKMNDKQHTVLKRIALLIVAVLQVSSVFNKLFPHAGFILKHAISVI